MTSQVSSPKPIVGRVSFSGYSEFFKIGTDLTLSHKWMAPMYEHPFKHNDQWVFSVTQYMDLFMQKNEGWRKTIYGELTALLFSKYSASRWLQHRLMATGTGIIVYCDPKDSTLGIGCDYLDAAADNPGLWAGSNFYGLALMDLRNHFKEVWKQDNLETVDGKQQMKSNKRKWTADLDD